MALSAVFPTGGVPDLNCLPDREEELRGDLEQIALRMAKLEAERPSNLREFQDWDRRRLAAQTWLDETERGLEEVRIQKSELSRQNREDHAAVIADIEARGERIKERIKTRIGRIQLDRDIQRSRHR